VNWQPIETAPKDQLVLMYYPPLVAPRGGSVRPDMYRVGYVGDSPREPSHWMPLPPPPKDIQGDEK